MLVSKKVLLLSMFAFTAVTTAFADNNSAFPKSLTIGNNTPCYMDIMPGKGPTTSLSPYGATPYYQPVKLSQQNTFSLHFKKGPTNINCALVGDIYITPGSVSVDKPSKAQIIVIQGDGSNKPEEVTHKNPVTLNQTVADQDVNISVAWTSMNDRR